MDSNNASQFKYSDTNAVVEVFTPGRLCILGEHSDWAGVYRVTNPSVSYGTS